MVSLDAHGARVMFQAIGTAINPRDKSVRENQLLIIAANPADDLGIVEAATEEGASYMLSAYSKISYTELGQRMMTDTP